MKKHIGELTLSVIGTGAAGGSLACALAAAGRKIDMVCDLNENAGRSIAARIAASWSRELSVDIARSDIVLVAVPDGKIESIACEASQLNVSLSHQVWLHISGALPPEVFSALEGRVLGIGAFHPACAFPKGKISTLLPGICFGVSGDRAALDIAERLAGDLKGRAVRIDADARPLYHAAAVLSSNAVLAVIAEARRALVTVGIEASAAESLCVSLATSAVQNAQMIGLDAALTGPVERGDTEMVRRHLQALVKMPSALSVYREMSLSIVRLARDAGRTNPDALFEIEQLLTSEGKDS